jgi:hypothetical protein
VYPGGPSPFLLGPAHARPRSRTPALSPRPLTGQPRLSAAPPPGTVSRLTRQLSLPCSVRSALARVAHVARERRARAAAGRHPPVRARPHGTSTLHGTPPPHAWTPTFSLLFSPLPRCRRAARSPLALLHSSSHLHSSRAPEPPHRSPHPDRRLQPPAAHSPSWIPVEHRRRPPLPGELLPSCQSLQFLAFSHPLASPVLQDPTPAVATHRSPLPADERRRPTPFAPPHRRPAVLMCPCPLLLARHLPRDLLEISSNTLPSPSRR